MIKTIAVLGLGKVGSLVSHFLTKSYRVIGVDCKKPVYEETEPSFEYRNIDVANTKQLEELLHSVDAVVSCLTFHLNKHVAEVALSKNVHYFDLTEDVETTHYIRQISERSNAVAIPQCGLAPGFIGIVGYDLACQFDELRDIELRVGALPRYPNGLFGYSFTWSPSGVINEYINDAEVIRNGVRKNVPSLQAIEHIQIEGQEFEAFSTSGGLGTLCETLEGKLDTLNYKTMRYPGHAKLVQFLLYELLLKKDKKLLEQILTEAKPPVSEDIVYVYAVVEGHQKGQIIRKEFCHSYIPREIDGTKWRAISWTTAASIVAVVDLVNSGKLPQRGFVKQEEIKLPDFLKTTTGSLFDKFKNHHGN